MKNCHRNGAAKKFQLHRFAHDFFSARVASVKRFNSVPVVKYNPIILSTPCESMCGFGSYNFIFSSVFFSRTVEIVHRYDLIWNVSTNATIWNLFEFW